MPPPSSMFTFSVNPAHTEASTSTSVVHGNPAAAYVSTFAVNPSSTSTAGPAYAPEPPSTVPVVAFPAAASIADPPAPDPAFAPSPPPYPHPINYPEVPEPVSHFNTFEVKNIFINYTI
jgi:hypothetical protein